MRFEWTIFAICLIILHTSMVGAGASSGIDWVSYEEALAASETEEKPIQVYFGAEWCPPCQGMKAEVFTHSSVIDASHAVIWVQVDVDDEPEMASKYGILAVPTMVYIDHQEEVILREVGYRSPSQLTGDIATAVEYHEDGVFQDEESSTPGFTYVAMILSVTLAAFFYHKKKPMGPG